MTTKHPKLKLARRLLSTKERRAGKSPFMSSNWTERAAKIQERVERQQSAAHKRATLRRRKVITA